jgi:hypothetical protein
MNSFRHLHVNLTSPKDPSILRRTWTVRVRCAHGSTSTPWRRACPDGCHLQSAAGAARCPRVTPTDDLVVTAGMLRHGLRLRCGCDEAYWMLAGPEHHKLETHVLIQDRERRLPADEEEHLRQSLLFVDPQHPNPWDAVYLDDPPWPPLED